MSASRDRGSALLVVVVVLLVLSGLGMAMVAMTDSDQQTVRWDNHVKDSLYVAEIGLRVGEGVLLAATSASADTLLAHGSLAQTRALKVAVPRFPQHLQEYDLDHLGTYLTQGGVELANQPAQLAAPPSGRPVPNAFYSLYVRNNPIDVAVADGNPATDARQDNDFTVNLISVGWVQVGDRILATKVLEEEYAWVGVGQEPSVQKLKDAGGTGSGQFGG